jgi:anhydro-N-acetylmuramic acid kinase
MGEVLDIGCMSGTSLDGIDAVLVRWKAQGPRSSVTPEVLGHHYLPYDALLRDRLRALNAPGPQELHEAALAANQVARAYAQAVQALLNQVKLPPQAVRCVGAHGQTVRHRPQEFDGTGYTLQLLNGALLAELCGIDVVCDFRTRDVAAGGQGAPLVPAFHAALFGQNEDIAVLNLGGIANLTLIPARGPDGGLTGEVRGFDCGPGNVLLDTWCERHTGQRFDAQGAWAAQGRMRDELLGLALEEPFFDQPPPKSTGRDLFNASWLDDLLSRCPDASSWCPQDVQATLAELTAVVVCGALIGEAPRTARVLVCGGGAFNTHLMERLSEHLGAAGPCSDVVSTDTLGVPPDQVEALAFAWLARAFMERQAGNLPAVTGARGPRVLGALYPAG